MNIGIKEAKKETAIIHLRETGRQGLLKGARSWAEEVEMGQGHFKENKPKALKTE